MRLSTVVTGVIGLGTVTLGFLYFKAIEENAKLRKDIQDKELRHLELRKNIIGVASMAWASDLEDIYEELNDILDNDVTFF